MEETIINDPFLGQQFEAIETTVEQKTLVHHWLCVGYVSPGAEQWIIEAGGLVKRLSDDPHIIAVGLAYDPRGCWTWSKGRQEYRHGVEYWSFGELQEASTGISLQYHNAENTRVLAEYSSCHTNYLILPDEEFDAERWQVKPEETIEVSSGNTTSSDTWLGDLDDHPF